MRRLVLVLVLITISKAMPPDLANSTATTRLPIGETIKQLTNQLMENNNTNDVILDTRTPPKVKQHMKRKNKPAEAVENSHAGVAIPVDEDAIHLEETTKKLSFYKIERPTTNSGLSTWILLNQQTTNRPAMVVEKNTTTTNKIKPIFKKRTTTTTTSTTTTEKPKILTTTRTTTNKFPSSGTTTIRITTTTTKNNETTKLTKIKASVLNSAKKNSTVSTTTEQQPINSTLPIEAKNGDVEIEGKEEDNKKTRRPSTNKRKKNKNRRRKPALAAAEKTDNTKIDKPQKKDKPIGTQLYNYLSREIMPTVGVGLVGLMVTAGLASYFLYPFGVARRSYDTIDRKDKEGAYYYNDEYSGGIAEEEAIGKVIAGMPLNSFSNTYKTPSSRYVNSYKVPTYPDNDGQAADQKFVVGNVPEEAITPVAVPEHGPRKRRHTKKRQLSHDDSENEITSDLEVTDNTQTTTFTTTSSKPSTTTTTRKPDKVLSFFDVMKDLMRYKIQLGLDIMQNATQSISRYLARVQSRFNSHYIKHNYYNITVDNTKH